MRGKHHSAAPSSAFERVTCYFLSSNILASRTSSMSVPHEVVLTRPYDSFKFSCPPLSACQRIASMQPLAVVIELRLDGVLKMSMSGR